MAKAVTVIGAGPGGLAVAMLLARAGVNVEIFERREVVGGRASLVKADGFTFDVGPTHLACPKALEEIFKVCGYDLHRKVTLVKLDPMYRLVFGQGGELVCAPHALEMEKRVAALSPQDTGTFLPWLKANRRKVERLLPAATRPCDRRHGRWSPKGWAARHAAKAGRSLDHELKRYFKDPRLQRAFSVAPRSAGLSPFTAPAALSVLAFLEYEYNLWHPIGGCGGICEIMARIAEELGVKIHLRQAVTQLAFSRQRVTGVVTGGEERTADAVVLGADFAAFMLKRVPYHLRPSWGTDRFRNAAHTCSHFVLLIGVEGRFDHLPHYTIYLPKEFAQNMEEIETRHTYSEQPMFWVQNPTANDDTLAPRGMSTLVVQVPVTHRDPKIHWSHKRDLYRDLVIRKLRRIGIKKWPRQVRFQQVITPLEWEKEYHLYMGASYGLAPNRDQILDQRPHNRYEDTERLYLVGASTHPGVSLPGVFESARITARQVLEDFGMDTAWLDAYRGGKVLQIR